MITDNLTHLATDISKPQLDPANARHNHDLNGIAKSLDKYGQRKPIVVNRRNNIVLAGNGTLKAARQLGWAEIAVVWVDDDSETATGYALADNRLTDLSEFDNEALLASLQQFEDIADIPGFDDFDFDALLAEVGGDLDLSGLGGEELIEDDPPIDKAEELQQVWQVQEGDIWELGRHRLICGDCTDRAVIDRLMDGEQCEIGFTSPPYNAGNAITGAYHINPNRKDFKKMYVHDLDNMPSDEYKTFLLSVLDVCDFVLDDIGAMGWNVSYNANSRREYGEVVFHTDNPLKVQETIVWDKTLGMNISGNNIYSRTAELVFLLSKTNKYRSNQNKGVFWNIWRINTRDGDNMQNGHGASFPVKLPSAFIENHSSINDKIFDPFLGSGTTLIAAEQLNRICYGSEISPKYCAVILQRYADLTGETPTKKPR